MGKSDQNVSTVARIMQGIEAGSHRQLIFTGLRVGGYGKVLDAILGEGRARSDAHIVERAQAAAITSAVGIAVANPSGATSTFAVQPIVPVTPLVARHPLSLSQFLREFILSRTTPS